MSFPYPIPFGSSLNKKRQRGQEVTVWLAILNLAELNLHPIPCLPHSLFCAEGDVNLPTNRLICCRNWRAAVTQDIRL